MMTLSSLVSTMGLQWWVVLLLTCVNYISLSIKPHLVFVSWQLYRIGAPVSQAIAPVTYMWQPISQQNTSMELDGCDESMKDLGEKSDLVQHCDSFRRLLVWIHASAFVEGYDNLKLACQKEVHFFSLLFYSIILFFSKCMST